MKSAFYAALLALLVSVAGCASVGQTGRSPSAQAGAANDWWYARFQMHCPQDHAPEWHYDLLIAHGIIGPVLARHRDRISLWRFHRRAVPDAAGHQFSFIFRTSAGNARKIYAEIQSSTILDEMKSAGMILRDLYDDTNKISKPDINSTSDPNWTPPLQKSWPYFIMGVSESWFDLISRLAEDGRKKPLSFAEMPEFYRELSREVDQTWVKEGSHAYLHHLNAIFGYVPLNIRGREPMRF
ncbi:MAG: hypothetical protein AB9866_22125 [Syntrophobacteraceae bacterium]